MEQCVNLQHFFVFFFSSTVLKTIDGESNRKRNGFNYLEFQFSHVIFSRKIAIMHPKSIMQEHDAMLDENDIQQINGIGTKISDKPIVCVLWRLKWEC